METAKGRGRVLIIEDEEALARLLRNQLERAGYSVRMEHTGNAGLIVAAEHWPDLVILDLNLPDIGGYEVMNELQRIYKPWHLPVLMLTALDSPKHRLLGFGHGADAYLTKPVASEELIRTVATLLAGSLPDLGAGA